MDLSKDILPFYDHDLYAKTAAAMMYDGIYSNPTYEQLFVTRDIILKKYPHNVVVDNAVNFMLYKLSPHMLKQQIKKRKEHVITHLNTANRDMAITGTKKIQPGSTIFVHSINSHVVELLKRASAYKHFDVTLLEHSPFGLGHALKEQLSNPVHVYPDLAMRNAIFHADACIIGADAAHEGAVGKLGSTAVAAFAKEHHIPVYVCHHSWKYHHAAEKLLAHTHEEEYDYKHAYENISADLITAHITEFGIFKPHHLHKEMDMHQPWMKYYR